MSKVFSEFNLIGKVLIVKALFDISSPYFPSPLVIAFLSLFFSYKILSATPSYFNSHTYSISSVFNNFLIILLFLSEIVKLIMLFQINLT